MKQLAVALILIGTAGRTAAAQRPVTSALMGIGYAAGGAAAGAMIAGRFPCNSTSDACNSKDVAGALVGAAVLGGFGIHAGNRFRGNLAADVGAGLAAAGLAIAARNGTRDAVVIPAAALGIAGMVVTEQATARRGPRIPTSSEIAGIPAPLLNREIHPKYATIYGTGGALLGGSAGLFLGATIGYRIAYQHDIQNGCEDCGLGGALGGAAIGIVTGAITGAIIGGKAGHRADREEAAARILDRGDVR